MYLDINNITGLNLYAYCNNNPIMYDDPEGNMPFLVVTAIIGSVIGFGMAAYNDYKKDGVWFNGGIGNYVACILAGTAIEIIGGLTASSLLTGNFLSNCSQVYFGLKGLAWAYTIGGPGAA
ncbi:MAG: hypothetical protein L6U99_09710 [Clostridium sp.]|nr:MAG: hypothetical protein L6U99_09710 [Clostridium sp.]